MWSCVMEETKCAQTHKPQMKKCPWQWSRKKPLEISMTCKNNKTRYPICQLVTTYSKELASISKIKKLTLRKTLNNGEKSQCEKIYEAPKSKKAKYNKVEKSCWNIHNVMKITLKPDWKACHLLDSPPCAVENTSFWTENPC